MEAIVDQHWTMAMSQGSLPDHLSPTFRSLFMYRRIITLENAPGGDFFFSNLISSSDSSKACPCTSEKKHFDRRIPMRCSFQRHNYQCVSVLAPSRTSARKSSFAKMFKFAAGRAQITSRICTHIF